MLKFKRGFTLIELVVVIVIIGILAGLALPTYRRALERGKQAEALQLLGAMYSAWSRYYDENGVKVPNPSDIDIELPYRVSGKNPNTKYWTYYFGNGAGLSFTKVPVVSSKRNDTENSYKTNYGLGITENGEVVKADAPF